MAYHKVMTLTIPLQPAVMLGMSGAIHLLPLYAIKEWTGIALVYLLIRNTH